MLSLNLFYYPHGKVWHLFLFDGISVCDIVTVLPLWHNSVLCQNGIDIPLQMWERDLSNQTTGLKMRQ